MSLCSNKNVWIYYGISEASQVPCGTTLSVALQLCNSLVCCPMEGYIQQEIERYTGILLYFPAGGITGSARVPATANSIADWASEQHSSSRVPSKTEKQTGYMRGMVKTVAQRFQYIFYGLFGIWKSLQIWFQQKDLHRLSLGLAGDKAAKSFIDMEVEAPRNALCWMCCRI